MIKRQRRKIEAFTAECREKGLSITEQRVAIFKELCTTDTHPSAEDIYGRLKNRIPTLSLATVYKTLDAFERHQFVTKTRATGEKARYDANIEPHHHLVCTECGKIQDLSSKNLIEQRPARNQLNGFEVKTCRVDFHGICKDCRS